ncbi:hypothetical protein IAU60_005838 [Kwoniella sp. DSM 27419]
MVAVPFRRFARKLQKAGRVILGPSDAASSLPPPQPSTTLQSTWFRKSTSVVLDPVFRRLAFPVALYPFLIIWTTCFILLVRQQYYLPHAPRIISCTAAPWDDWPPDTCGSQGVKCQDSLGKIDGQAFRCMGGCRDTSLGNPRYIGNERVNGVPLLIGGGDPYGTYRADSWVCASAIHSGLVSPTLGGCVNFHAMPYPQGHSGYASSESNGLVSIAFSPFFPGAFRLSAHLASGCLDLHYIITGVNAFCLAVTTLFMRPPPALLFTILLVGGYFHLTLFVNPPHVPPNWETIFARLPPVLLTGYWAWQVSFKRTMGGFIELPFEHALWQGAGFWMGIESHVIFAKLPISRLGYDALDPGGVIALTVIIVIMVMVVLVQAWQMRKYGLLRYYLIRYIGLVPLLIILAFIPSYTFRPHHYLLALIAIPVLSLPNRISLFGQAFALGLFLDGVGRWGWDGVIQLTGSLLGDANSGSYIPEFWRNATTSAVLGFDPLNTLDKMYYVSGYSVLVDDMQAFSNYTNASLNVAELNLAPGIDHYFRLAFIANGSSLDFTKPVTWFANQSWSNLGTA